MKRQLKQLFWIVLALKITLDQQLDRDVTMIVATLSCFPLEYSYSSFFTLEYKPQQLWQ